MPKMLIRLFVFLLIPSLGVDPGLASGLVVSQNSPSLTYSDASSLFTQQALSSPIAAARLLGRNYSEAFGEVFKSLGDVWQVALAGGSAPKNPYQFDRVPADRNLRMTDTNPDASGGEDKSASPSQDLKNNDAPLVLLTAERREDLINAVAAAASASQETVRGVIASFDVNTLYNAYVRRWNLQGFYLRDFKETWNSNPSEAIHSLSRGFRTYHSTRKKGSLLFKAIMNQLPPGLSQGLPPGLRDFKVSYGRLAGVGVDMEWGYFPSLQKWLPVALYDARTGEPGTKTIRTVVDQTGRVLFSGLGIRRDDLVKICAENQDVRVIGRASALGIISTGRYETPTGRDKGTYVFSEHSLQVFDALLSRSAIALHFRIDGQVEPRSLLLAFDVVDGQEVVLDSQNHYLVESSLQAIAHEQRRPFWLRGLQGVGRHFRDPSTSDVARFNAGVNRIEGWGPEGRKTVIDFHQNYSLPAAYIDVFVDFLIDTSAIPVFFRPERRDTGLSEGFLKVIGIRTPDGGWETVTSSYRDVYWETIQEAMLRARLLGGVVVIQNLKSRVENRTDGDTPRMMVAVGGESYEILGHPASGVRRSLDAEVIYRPGDRDPVEIRLGVYSTDNPLEYAQRRLQVEYVYMPPIKHGVSAAVWGVRNGIVGLFGAVGLGYAWLHGEAGPAEMAFLLWPGLVRRILAFVRSPEAPVRGLLEAA